MFEQFQKGVSKVETGLLEYVAKKQASNVIKQIEQPNNGKDNDIGYFDKLKRKLFNNEEQQSQQQQNITSNQKVNQNNNNNNANQQWQQQQDRVQQDGIQNERQPQVDVQQESEISRKLREKLGISAKSGEQFREVHNEVSKKAKQVASDLGDQFYKLIGKKPVEKKEPERSDSGQQKGWIVEDNKNNNWRIEEEEQEEMKQNHKQIQRPDTQQLQKATSSRNGASKGQAQQIDGNNQRENCFNNSVDSNLNKEGIKRLSQNRIFRKIEEDSSSESDSSLNSPYIQAPSQKIGWQAQNESFENHYQRTNNNRNNNGQQQQQQYDRSPLSRKRIFESGSEGINRQEALGKQDFNRNYSQNSQRFLQSQNQNVSSENYGYQQQEDQFNQQRFNRNSSLNGSSNMSGLNNSENNQNQRGYSEQQSYHRQDQAQNSQKSSNTSRNYSQDMIPAMMNYSNQNGSYYQAQEVQNANDKLDQIYYESDDFGAVLQYELNMAMEINTQRRLTPNEKRERYLLGLENMVQRVENLRECQLDIEDKIGQSVNQTQLQNGIYQMLGLADTTDQTTGKVQRVRVKIANYKALYIQRGQQIQKLSKASKKLSVFISFITKIQSKYSDLILFSSVSINSQLLHQFPSILESLHSLSTSALAENSSGLKLLKAIQHAAISNFNKIQAIYTILQDILTKDILRPRQINNILDIHRYTSFVRSYFTLTQKFPKQFPLFNAILQESVKNAVVSMQTDQIMLAHSKISKQQTLSASIRVNSQNQQRQYKFTNIPVNMFCDSLSAVFHELTLLLMVVDQIQSSHVKSLMYPKEILDFHDQETSQLRQQVTDIATEQLSDIINTADWNELTNSGMTERVIVLISQFMVVLKEFHGSVPNEISNVLKIKLVKQLQKAAKELNLNLRKAVKQDNWVNQQLDEEYLQKLVFQLRKNQNEQAKRIFNSGVNNNNYLRNLVNSGATNPINNLAQSQQIPTILANYRVNQVFAIVPQPRQLTQIEMKQPDAPVEDLDSSLFSFNHKPNILAQQANIQTSLIKNPYSFNNMNINNKEIPLLKSLQNSNNSNNSQHTQQRSPLQCCSSSLAVVDSMFKIFQLVQVMTPIAYEVLLEAQKMTEEYIYQISCLFIRKITRDILSDSFEDLSTLPSICPSILEQERLLQSLEKVHFKAIQSSKFPNLKRIFTKISLNSEQKSDTESKITNQFISFRNNNASDFSNKARSKPADNNNILFCGMPTPDLNIFTMSRAEKQQQQSPGFSSSFADSDNLLVMIEFDLKQRLSAKESINTIIRFMQMAESTLFHQLSLVDTAISAQQFTRKIFNEELAMALKELGLLIVKDYIDSSIQKERLFSDFDAINWKPAEYFVEVVKPIYIDNSLFFIKEILREQQKYQQQAQGLFFQELLMECWHNQFREIIAQVRKFSDKGRAKLLQHFYELKKQMESIIFETQGQNSSNYPSSQDRFFQNGLQYNNNNNNNNNNLSLSSCPPKEILQNISTITEQFISIQNTNSVSDLLEFILNCKDKIPLSVLLSIIRSSDRLILFLSSQKYYDTLLTRIYSEFHMFSQNSQLK